MVPIRPPISKSSSLYTKTSKIVPRASITIGITINFMFLCFSSYLARSHWFFTLCSAGIAKSMIRQVLVIIIIIMCFSHQHSLMIFHCNLHDSKSLQASRTLLRNLASINCLISMVSIRLPISGSFSSLSMPLGTVPSNYNEYHRYSHVP